MPLPCQPPRLVSLSRELQVSRLGVKDPTEGVSNLTYLPIKMLPTMRPI